MRETHFQYSMMVRKKAEQLKEIGANHYLTSEWLRIFPFNAEHVARIGQLMEQVALMVPNDVLPLERPAIGETWDYKV